MSRFGKFAFALGAHAPLIVVPVSLVGMLFFFPPGPVSSPAQGQTIEQAWLAFGIAMGASLLAFMITLVVALVSLFRDPRLTPGLRAFWAFGMLLLGALMVPVYFWVRVLPAPPRSGEGAP